MTLFCQNMEITEDRYVRSVDDVKAVIGHAKLEEKELRGLTQVVYMSDFTPDNYRLVELNREVINALNNANEVVLRGRAEDRAVLCTEDKTFEVKEAETSNSLLVVPGLIFPQDVPLSQASERILERKEVVGVFYEYLELREVEPRVSGLRGLLVAYRGSELESEVDVDSLMSSEQLLQVVQMSRVQLKSALVQLEAFQIQGKWRVLEFDYHWRCLSFLLNLIDENSWDLDEIPIGETLSCLKELLPSEVLNHILEIYLRPTGAFNHQGEELYSLEKRKVSRFCAQVLLRPAEKFNLKDFMTAWQQSVPEAIETELSDLEGTALYDAEARPPVIWYFAEESLSDDIHERFAKLFSVRPKWTLQQISPYIRRLAMGKQTVNALLTKHARASNINGTKYYSARHGK